MRAQVMEPEEKQVMLQTWQLVEDKFDTDSNAVKETLFSLGNGHIGLRGSHEEGFAGLADKSLDGTFINGFYESSPLQYPETSHALAKVHQFMLNVPNAKCINVSVGEEEFDPFQGKIAHYDRSVDFRTGLLTRNINWNSPSNRRISISSRRLV